METSATIAALAKALNEFQAEVDAVGKDGRNTHRNSRYATWANIRETVFPVLTKHGLALTQHPEGADTLTSLLLHVSGEWLRSTLTMCVGEEKRERAAETYIKTPQTHAISITYYKRNAASAILGLAFDDDDDGEQPSPKTTEKPAATVKRPTTPPRTDQGADRADSWHKAFDALWKTATAGGYDHGKVTAWTKKEYTCTTPRDMLESQLIEAAARLEHPQKFSHEQLKWLQTPIPANLKPSTAKDMRNGHAPAPEVESPRGQLFVEIGKCGEAIAQATLDTPEGQELPPHIQQLKCMLPAAEKLYESNAATEENWEDRTQQLAKVRQGDTIQTGKSK